MPEKETNIPLFNNYRPMQMMPNAPMPHQKMQQQFIPRVPMPMQMQIPMNMGGQQITPEQLMKLFPHLAATSHSQRY